MSGSLRLCVIIAAVLLGLLVAAVVAFNIHLQSAAMQERLRAGALQTIGLPLSVRSVDYTPWGGIRLRGLVVPDMENEGVNFLEASEFQIVFRLLPLLRREFSVSSVTLSEAVLTWRQNAEGRWRVPRHPEQAAPVVAGTPRPAATPSPSPAPPPAEIAPAFELKVDEVKVRHSRILFENRDAWPLLDAEGITASAKLDADGNARGEASVPEAVLAGLVVARHLASPFTLNDGLLELPEIRGEVSGGTLGGRGSIATRTGGSPYDWSLRLDGLRLQELLLPDAFGGTKLEGVVGADFTIAGRNAPGREVDGRAEIEIEGGRMIPSEYLRNLGRLLGISELQGIDFREARAKLRIEDDLVHVEPLWLRADEFAVEMRGPVTRAGGLQLQARLLLGPSVAARMTALTGRQLPAATAPAPEGFRQLDFTVGGTLRQPQSNLASRILGGGAAGQIGDFFLNILGAP